MSKSLSKSISTVGQSLKLMCERESCTFHAIKTALGHRVYQKAIFCVTTTRKSSIFSIEQSQSDEIYWKLLSILLWVMKKTNKSEKLRMMFIPHMESIKITIELHRKGAFQYHRLNVNIYVSCLVCNLYFFPFFAFRYGIIADLHSVSLCHFYWYFSFISLVIHWIVHIIMLVYYI